MSEHDAFAERERALEDEYFRKKDRELIRKMQAASDAERARGELGRETGLSDPALLQDLQDMGFTPQTVVLLPLVPVIETAWAEGGVTSAERGLVVKLARSRGIGQGSPADAQLQAWLDSRPDPVVFARAGRLIAAMQAEGPQRTLDMTADDLVAQCERIAAISGSFLGLGRVSPDEKALLARIASELKARRG
jgi:hypothetical protein